MLAPGPPDAQLQVLDVRDLAAFILGRLEASAAEVYGVVGPDEPITTRDVVETARATADADTTFAWASPEFLASWGGDVQRWFPMWHPDEPGAHTYDARKAVAAGLRRRSLQQTIADTLAWDRARGEPRLEAGLPDERERQVLDAWHAGRKR